MISIIICSKKPDISQALRDNINKTIGVDYEIIVIDNSQNNYSIFSAYNKGLSQSNYPYLCFVHDDVLFKTEKWGVNLINHLSEKDTGIIGIAGGKIISKIPSSWSVDEKYMNVLQYKPKKNISVLQKLPSDFVGCCQNVLLLDGVFLAMKRELFTQIHFDEHLSGFHGYDYDISIQSIVAGFKNYVVYDILLEHFSEGNKNAFYYSVLLKVYKKWEDYLPLFSCDVPDKIRLSIDKIEARRLGKLMRRMARNGFETRKIVSEVANYVGMLNTKDAKRQMNFIYLKILFEKVFNT